MIFFLILHIDVLSTQITPQLMTVQKLDPPVETTCQTDRQTDWNEQNYLRRDHSNFEMI